MTEYQILTNRLEKVKLIQKKCIDSIQPEFSRQTNDNFYRKFCKAANIGYCILERMINVILDKEGVGIKNMQKVDLGKSFDKLKETL